MPTDVSAREDVKVVSEILSQMDGLTSLADTEMNYDATRIRTNYLSVSQVMFMRGLFVLGVAAIFLFFLLTPSVYQSLGLNATISHPPCKSQ